MATCVPSEPVAKKLFLLSRNRCAFRDPITGSGCEQALADRTWDYVIGEMAHIAGCRDGSPRHDSLMDPKERNGYENLVVLCPTDHTVIDKARPDDFTVEYLTQMKYDHEEADDATATLFSSYWAQFADQLYQGQYGIAPSTRTSLQSAETMIFDEAGGTDIANGPVGKFDDPNIGFDGGVLG
jgi:hypothetical protein